MTYGFILSILKVIIDCAHCATYHIAPDVFRELDANVIAIGVEPDGFNINDGVGSTHIENLQQHVLHENADLGIAFDGDGDRVIMVDGKGNVVDGVYLVDTEEEGSDSLIGR